MKNRLSFAIFLMVLFLQHAVAVSAVEEAKAELPLGLETHGFISQGFFISSNNNYLTESKHGSFSLTEVGLNLRKELSSKLNVGLQLFSRKIGDTGNFAVQFDWFFFDYRWINEFGIKFGRIKIPFGLSNETSDIDSARVSILLPQSIYPIASRDFLLASTGAQAYGYADMSSVGSLEYRAYAGTIHITTPSTVTSLRVPYLYGSRLLWETPLNGLKLGASVQKLRLDFSGAVSSQTVSMELAAVLYVASAEYVLDRLQLVTEFSRWHTNQEGDRPDIVANTKAISERFYVMLNYYLLDSFATGIYYSSSVADISTRHRVDRRQGDLALSLRFDVNPNWLVKLEGHYMNGMGGLSSSLNGGKALSTLDINWLSFFAKTTVNF